MRRTLLFAFAMMFALSLASCKKHDPLQDPIPTDPISFRTYLMKRMGPTLEATTCKCCGKSLHQCFKETVEKKAGPKCPDT